MAASVLALSFQAAYLCRHSGACCTSGWPIPVEASLALELRQALASGELRLSPDEGGVSREPLEAPSGLPPEIGALTKSSATGVCAFYERGTGLCAIHHQLGRDRLPSSCAHFPRVCLIDEDATYVTLSHYCPTVAGLLFDADGETGPAAAGARPDRPVIVPAPPALLAGMRVEGLDARGQLPPLLRPGMLADRRSYRAWERFVAGELAGGRGAAEDRLAAAAAVTDRVTAWSPASGTALEEHVERCIAHRAADGGVASPARAKTTRELYDEVRDSCPAGLAPPPAPAALEPLMEEWVDPEWEGWAPVVGRYLAAKVFGSWLAYQGRGLSTVLGGAFAALAVLKVEAARQCAPHARRLDAPLLEEAIRQADLLMVHLADREDLAGRLNLIC